MENPNPTREFRKSLDKVVRLVCVDSCTPIQLQEAWTELTEVFVSPEFTRYRESVGKLSGMMPMDYPGMQNGKNVYFENYRRFLQYWNLTTERAVVGKVDEMLPYLSGLRTHLSVMEEHQEDFDRAFSS